MSNASLMSALEEWRAILGADRVQTDESLLKLATRDTSRFSQPVPAILVPRSAEQIPAVVRIASKHRVPLYPVSTGHNWGYGTSNPASPNCVILSLRDLTRISLAEDLGLVTLEPGVTQQQLFDFLAERRAPFIVPVTGAGPTCSILGNALERGFGLAPIGDHFGALTNLEAVLPSGELYRTPLTELGAPLADQAFKWGMGPYLDGIFTQGSFGVVTRGTIALARRSQHTTVFFFYVEEDSGLERAVLQVQQVARQFGANIGNINLMNRRRIQLMAGPAAARESSQARIIGVDQVPAWTGVGVIYGSGKVSAAVRSEIEPLLKVCSRSVRFIDTARILKLNHRLQKLPAWVLRRTRSQLERLIPSLKILMGEPSTVALRLAYASLANPPDGTDLDPARDGRGVYWYSPLIPMRPPLVRAFTEMVREVTETNGVPPAITLTSMSDRCFDSTVPILFDVTDSAACERAETCYRTLFDRGNALGVTPYRMGAQNMDLVVRPEAPYWKLAAQLKAAVDPQGIISPGRYTIRSK